MKKSYVWVTTIIITLLISIIFIAKWPHHLLGENLCGSGFEGVKTASIYYIFILIILLASFLLYKSNKKFRCKHCKSPIDKKMFICPYCGMEIEGEVTSK
jgi:hypothetical protein